MTLEGLSCVGPQVSSPASHHAGPPSGAYYSYTNIQFDTTIGNRTHLPLSLGSPLLPNPRKVLPSMPHLRSMQSQASSLSQVRILSPFLLYSIPVQHSWKSDLSGLCLVLSPDLRVQSGSFTSTRANSLYKGTIGSFYCNINQPLGCIRSYHMPPPLQQEKKRKET